MTDRARAAIDTGLPNLAHRGAHNETPLPLDTGPRTAIRRPSLANVTRPMLPSGADLRALVLRRVAAQPQSLGDLMAGLRLDYTCRGGAEQDVNRMTCSLIDGGLIHRRGLLLRMAEDVPEKTETIMPESNPDQTKEPGAGAARSKNKRRKGTPNQTIMDRAFNLLSAEPMERAQIADALDVPVKAAGNALDRLRKAGRIEPTGRGADGRAYVWRLTQRDEQPDDAAIDRAILERVGRGMHERAVVIPDLLRLHPGWTFSSVADRIRALLGDDTLARLPDGRISRAIHGRETEDDPPAEGGTPAYEVLGEDDGEIPEPPQLSEDVGQLPSVPEYRDTWPEAPEWVIFDGHGWTGADTEADARAMAERHVAPGQPVAVYQRLSVCRVRMEWDDAEG